MSSTPASSTPTANLNSRRYFSKAILSMASLTLAAGGLATLGAPAQAAATPTTQVPSAAVETQGQQQQKGCDVDAYKPHYKKYQGKHYAAFPFKVKCEKGYTKVQVKQYYYAEDKHGNSHEHGSDYYQYSFNHHGGETWGGGAVAPLQSPPGQEGVPRGQVPLLGRSRLVGLVQGREPQDRPRALIALWWGPSSLWLALTHITSVRAPSARCRGW